MNIKYIIVDDEPLAHKVIEKYCEDLPFLDLKANCYDALQALAYLRDNSADLIFLDIQMPRLKGFDFLRTMGARPQIIVTSAYQEHALEGYDLDICDYLLKPFGFERFLKAVNKAVGAISQQAGIAVHPGEPTAVPDRIFVKGEKKHHQLRLDQILYIESEGSESKIHTGKGMIATAEKISSLAERLPDTQFVRVHKSFVVAAARIDTIEGNRILIGKHVVPIGRVYRTNVLRLLN